MLGLRILFHALRQVLLNLGPVARIFLIPTLVLLAAAWGLRLNFLFSPYFLLTAWQRGMIPWAKLAVFILLAEVLLLWSAVAWHRFILLNERGHGLLPPLHPLQMWGYFVRGLWLLLLGVPLFFAQGFVVGFVRGFTKAAFHVSPGLVVEAVGLCLALPFVALMLRLFVAVVPVAVGRDEQTGSVWRSMRLNLWPLVVVSAGLLLFDQTLSLGVARLGMTSMSTPGLSLTVASQSLATILSLSVLTTLYGHYVEGRPLV